MNTKVMSKLLLVGLFLATFTVAMGVSAADPGSDFVSAIAITDDGETKGTLPGPSASLSWYYKFTVNTGQDIVLELKGPAATDFDLTLYNPTQNIAAFTVSGTYPKTMNLLSVKDGGTWYVEVIPGFELGSGEFTLTLTRVTREGGLGSSFTDAIPIEAGPNAGSLPGSAPDGSMYYQFKVETGQTIDLSLVGAAKSDFDLLLYGPAQNLLESSTLGTYPESVSYPDADAGTYFVQVKLVTGFGDFAFFLAVAEYSGPGSSADEAVPITPGTFESELPGPSPESGIWYSFEVMAGQDIYLELDASEEDADFGLSLFNPDQKLLGLTGEEKYPRSLVHLRADAGAHFVEVIPFGGVGPFSLTLNLVSPEERAPGTDFETAIEIGPGETMGELPGPSENNGLMHVFKAEPNQEITLSVKGPAESEFELNLFNPDQKFLGAAPDVLKVLAKVGGSYYVEVIPLMGEGEFQLTLNLEEKALVTTTTPMKTTTESMAPETTTESMAPETTTETTEGPPVPGFEIFSVLAAIPFLLWFRRHRR